MNSANFLDQAMEYHRRGWVPTPIKPPIEGEEKSGKAPVLPDWPNRRLEPRELTKYFNNGKRHNLGIVTGKPSGIVVLDFDSKAAFEAFGARHPNAVDTYTVARDNAEPWRRHLYFEVPGKAPKNAKGDGWDFQSSGRQVVAPPSRHYSGGTYRVVNPVSPLPWRPEYLECLPKHKEKPQSVPATPVQVAIPTVPPQGREAAYLQAALQREAQAVAGTLKGSRNNRLNEAAFSLGQLVAAGLSESDIKATLLTAARQAGLSEHEARATIESGLTKGKQEPRAIPADAPALPSVDVSGLLKERKPKAGSPAVHADEPEAGAEPESDEWIPFPLNVLPVPIADFVRVVSVAHNVDETAVVLPLLGTASAALGNAYRLKLKDGWLVPPTLWCIFVAKTGSNKSGPLELITGPMWEPPPMQGVDGTELVRPPQGQYVIDDATTEAVLQRLSEAPRGLLLARDELGGWLQSFDAYRKGGKGGDEQKWMRWWDVKPYRLDRKTDDERNQLPAPSVAIAGAIQPEVFGKCTDADKLANGFSARGLVAMPPSRKRVWTDQGVSEDQVRFWTGILNELRTRPFSHFVPNSATFAPHIVELSPQTRPVWVAWYNTVAERVYRACGVERALTAKADVQAVRIALTIYGLQCALGELEWGAENPAETMRAGVQAAEWFLNEGLRVFRKTCQRAHEEHLAKLARLAEKKQDDGVVKVRDFQRASDRYKGKGGADRVRSDFRSLAKAGFGVFENDQFTLKPERSV